MHSAIRVSVPALPLAQFRDTPTAATSNAPYKAAVPSANGVEPDRRAMNVNTAQVPKTTA